MRWLALALVFVWFGCNSRPLAFEDSPKGNPDAATSEPEPTPVDLRAPDATNKPADLSHHVSDFSVPPRDLRATDLAQVADLAVPADLAIVADLASPPDLERPSDIGCVPVGPTAPTGQPAPLFGTYVPFAIPKGVSGASAAIGDVTGDGRADVVVGASRDANSSGGAQVLVFPQTATGTLGTPISYSAGPSNVYVNATSIKVADLNGDGRLDVVVTLVAEIGVLLQNAAGGLDPIQTYAAVSPGTEEMLAVGDLNGDGLADVAAVQWHTTDVNVWYQTAQGTLSSALSLPCPHDGWDHVAIGDLNSDGRADILVTSEQTSNASVLLQQPGGFAPFELVQLGRTGNGIAIGDLNDDCRSDIAFAGGGNTPTGFLGWLPQTGQGSFAASTFLASTDIPDGVEIADVDGDRRPDVVVMHEAWTTFGIYRQLPGGGLAPEERYPFASINWGSGRLAVGDVNSDGRPDIVAADYRITISYHR
jgi:hypothetical protein